MFVYIRSPAFVIVVTQKLVLQQSKNVTAKCTETLSPPLSIQFSLNLLVSVENDGMKLKLLMRTSFYSWLGITQLCLEYKSQPTRLEFPSS